MAPTTFLRRFATMLTSALVASGALVGLFTWIALTVEWEIPEPAELGGPSTITARDGTVLARFDAEVDRRPVSLDAVSPEAIAVVVAAEDARFYEHEGVDALALLRAIVTNVRTGEIRQGGSTLTQQYVKNAFTEGDRTVMRKVREAVISIQLEREQEKDTILERYLNTVYFGEGAYGIEAAALTFFGVSAAELDLAQAAALVQGLPAPSVRNPRLDPSGAVVRRDLLLDRIATLGLVERSAAEEAREQPLEVRERQPWSMNEPYFVSRVRQEIEAAFGAEALIDGALDIRTTLDLDAQARLREAVDEHLAPPETGFEAGVAVVHPATGDVLAIHGGRDFYGDTSAYSATNYAQLNLAMQGRRQAGSTFKPFVLAAAMEQGIEPATRYPAPAQITIGDWRVRNADGRNYGRLSLTQAMVSSVNTVYARLGIDVGPESIVDVARRLGVASTIEPDPTISLGAMAHGPTVLDMASAFATLANDGLACPARTILDIHDRDGAPVEVPESRRPDPELLDERPDALKQRDEGRCYQAVDPDIARELNGILEGVVRGGTGTRARIGRPQAGKTGTTNDLTDAWFVGYTPDLSMAVWIGDPDERRTIENIGGFGRVFGGTLPAVMWRTAALLLLEDVAERPFAAPGEDRRAGRAPAPALSPEPTAPSPPPTPTPDPEPDEPEQPDDDATPDEVDDEDEEEESSGPCFPPLFTSGC